MWTFTFRQTLFALLLSLGWAHAATITVTTTTDVTANDGQCSLREAIAAANSQTASGDAQGECIAGSDGLNTVVVPEGTYNLTSSLAISSDIRINGAGMNETLIDGGNSVRVLYLNSGYRLTLNGVRIIGGNSGGAGGAGGGLYMESGSFARIESSRFSANSASSGGGAIYLGSEAFLDVFSSTFTNNSANNGGAILSDYGMVTLTDATLSGNSASSTGGALFLYTGNLTIRSSEFSNNSADSGGAMYVYYSSHAQLDDVSITNNTASSSGGGIYIFEYSLMRINAGNISNNSASSGGAIYLYHSSIELDDVTVDGNSASVDAGGIFLDTSFANILNSSLDTNTAGFYGGGFYLDYPSVLWFANTDLVANHADGRGGAGFADYSQLFMRDGRIADNTSDDKGGGLYLEGNPAHLERVAVINNRAQGNGGGLYIVDDSGIYLRNTTLSGNESTSGSGGGIYIYDNASLEIAHSTITDNEAASEGGGIHLNSGGKLAYHASIIAGNRASDGEDCYFDSTALSRGFNVLGDETGCVTEASDLSIASSAVTTSLLAPLADNGGPTPTHALRPGSLADNAADNDYCPLTDQRGTARMQNGFDCDIGAYERVNEQPSDSPGNNKKKSGGSPTLWGLGLLSLALLWRRRAVDPRNTRMLR